MSKLNWEDAAKRSRAGKSGSENAFDELPPVGSVLDIRKNSGQPIRHSPRYIAKQKKALAERKVRERVAAAAVVAIGPVFSADLVALLDMAESPLGLRKPPEWHSRTRASVRMLIDKLVKVANIRPDDPNILRAQAWLKSQAARVSTGEPVAIKSKRIGIPGWRR